MLRFTFALAALCIVLVSAVAMLISATQPPDMPCINWKAWNFQTQTPNPSEMFIVSDHAWVMQYNNQECSVLGSILPCWSQDAGHAQTFGHHDYQPQDIPNDYCRIYENTTGMPDVYEANNFLLPFKGPKYDTHSVKLVQTGGPVPDDVIRVNNRAMAISTTRAKNNCAGIGFSGWAEIIENADGSEVFGDVHFSIVAQPFTTTTFQVATCKAYTNPPATTTLAPMTATPPPPTTTFAPNTKPFIRFGHAVAVTEKVTATITQGTVSNTWSCYSFGEFSGWVQKFSVGNGHVSIKSCNDNSPIINQTMYLSPGPLVIVIKGYWPLNQFSLEGVAASYIPPTSKSVSGARLVNLMADVVSAGMDGNGKKLVDGVKFTTSSVWAPVTADEQMTFTAIDDVSGKTLTTNKFQAPEGPAVFSNFLIGLSSSNASSTLGPQMIPLLDAPEQ